MGAIVESLPKALIPIHGQPILWYVVQTLKKNGVRDIVLPLGYKGDQIRDYVTTAFAGQGLRFHMAETGVETLIAGRMSQIRDLIPAETNFFLLNSDTIFDFDLREMMGLHLREGALVTLSSVETVSSWGLIHIKDGALHSFSRERKVHYVMSNDDPAERGYINSGIAILNRKALDFIDLNSPQDFEQNVYTKIIKMGRAALYEIKGNWFAVDTPKDLQLINQITGQGEDRGGRVHHIQERLANTEAVN